jgi:diguanylate cyclase (GGDEF)-like protein
MAHKRIDSILRNLQVSLSLLFLMFVTIAIYIAFLTNKSYDNLNEYSSQSSLNIHQSLLHNEQNDLGKLVSDYSFWNEAVESLAIELDESFLQENFYGSYLEDTFQVERVLVFDLDGTVELSIYKGSKGIPPNELVSSPELQLVFEQVMQMNFKAPSPVTAFINIDGKLHLIAASTITPNVNTEQLAIGDIYGVMLMAKPFDDALLMVWESQFHLYDLKLQPVTQEVASGYISLPMISPTGEEMYNVVWQPDLPGERYIGEMLPSLVMIVIFVGGISIIFGIYINRYIQLTLDAANELEKNRNELHTLAHYDSVTRLPNRILGLDRLEQALKASARTLSLTAVLFIDLDDFKSVNDNYGHDIGDQILVKTGQGLESCVRLGVDTIARIGGDEFIVILANLKHQGDATIVAEKIIGFLANEMIIDGQAIKVSASIGISVTSLSGMSSEEVIKKADNAMYQAKKNGKNKIVLSE